MKLYLCVWSSLNQKQIIICLFGFEYKSYLDLYISASTIQYVTTDTHSNARLAYLYFKDLKFF